MNIPTEAPARFMVTPNGEPTVLLGETAPIEPAVPVYEASVPYTFDPPERMYTSAVGEKLQPEETLQVSHPTGIRRAMEHIPEQTGNILALGALVGGVAVFGITEAFNDVEEQAREEQKKAAIRQELQKLAQLKKPAEPKTAIGRPTKKTAAPTAPVGVKAA